MIRATYRFYGPSGHQSHVFVCQDHDKLRLYALVADELLGLARVWGCHAGDIRYSACFEDV